MNDSGTPANQKRLLLYGPELFGRQRQTEAAVVSNRTADQEQQKACGKDAAGVASDLCSPCRAQVKRRAVCRYALCRLYGALAGGRSQFD